MLSSVSIVAFRLLLRGLLALSPARNELARAARRAAGLSLSDSERESVSAIDALRLRLSASDQEVEVVDYGAGMMRGGRPPLRRVSEIYRSASSARIWGRFLGALTRELQPRRVLELGTNLGVSAAHIAAALSEVERVGGPRGRLVTLEGADSLASLAEANLTSLGHQVGEGERVEIVVGPFAETLDGVCRSRGPFDVVFVDGHHEEQATLDYIEIIRPHLAAGAVVVLDDVEPGRAVWWAWRRVRRDPSTCSAVHLGRLGLISFEPSTPVTPPVEERLGTLDPQSAAVLY